MDVGPVHGGERGRPPDTGVDLRTVQRADERQRTVDASAPQHVPVEEFLRMMGHQPRFAFAVANLLPPVALDRRAMVMPDERRPRKSDFPAPCLHAPAHVDVVAGAQINRIEPAYGEERFARGLAAAIVRERAHRPITRTAQLRDRLRDKLLAALPEVYLNGPACDSGWRLPGNLNISFAYVEGEGLLMALKDVALSSGSACTSASLEPSYVLRALGVGEELAHTSIRFGLGRFTTEEEVDYVADLVIKKVNKLRELSPLWEMKQEGIDLNSINWAANAHI